MDLKKDIGKFVKKRRNELNLKQSTLSDYANIGSTNLSNLEGGKANITLDSLQDILEVLGLEIIIQVKSDK